MSWSHIRCFYPFTFNIKKTTPILKKYIFVNILSYSYQTQKIWLKKVYLTCNISKSNRDFHSIFFLSDAENRLWWYYQKDFRILRKFQTWFFPLLGTLCAGLVHQRDCGSPRVYVLYKTAWVTTYRNYYTLDVMVVMCLQ